MISFAFWIWVHSWGCNGVFKRLHRWSVKETEGRRYGDPAVFWPDIKEIRSLIHPHHWNWSVFSNIQIWVLLFLFKTLLQLPIPFRINSEFPTVTSETFETWLLCPFLGCSLTLLSCTWPMSDQPHWTQMLTPLGSLCPCFFWAWTLLPRSASPRLPEPFFFPVWRVCAHHSSSCSELAICPSEFPYRAWNSLRL